MLLQSQLNRSWLVLIGIVVLLGCRNTPPHPPTFADFHRIGPGLLSDTNKIEAQIAVFKAAMFRAQEFGLIRSKGQARELIGAALTATVADPIISTLTYDAFLKGSNDPVVLTGYIQCHAREVANGVETQESTRLLEQTLNALERLEADNGFPQLIRANLLLRHGDTNGARLSLQAASTKPFLRLRQNELRLAVHGAALTAHYPPFTAWMMALGAPTLGLELSNASRALIADPELDLKSAEACLELGRRYETQATLLIDQLIAFSVQKRALEFLKPPGLGDELKRMQATREQLMKVSMFLDSPTAHQASERLWLDYLEMVFTQSELSAAHELARRLNSKF